MTAQERIAVYAEVSRMAHAAEKAAMEAGDSATQAIISATKVRVLADHALERVIREAEQAIAHTA
jgi:hypothetical protein